MKTAVIEAITATSQCTPLLLPFLETSLRDSSPNSKEQAAMALLRLVEKHGWSHVMCEGAVMTNEEEERWSDLILVAFVFTCLSERIHRLNGKIKSGNRSSGCYLFDHRRERKYMARTMDS